MGIKRVSVTNFKSFRKLDVELGKFNVVIGPNASGKSNFVRIFEFLRDIADSGLNNAISMQGGVEYLRNINIGASEDLSLKVIYDQEFTVGSVHMGVKINETTYEFEIGFKDKQKRGLEFEITKDRLTHKCRFVRKEVQKNKLVKVEDLGQGEIILSRDGGEVKIELHKPEGVPIREDEILLPFQSGERLLSTTPIFLESFSLFISYPSWKSLNREISIYDIDPKLPKKAIPITGKAELEEDGSNLSIILKNLVEDKEKSRKLFNLVKDLLPFINNLDVEKFVDRSFLFKLQEIYFKNKYIPAPLISDGTINITALIIALYFEKKPIIIIEEPERNIHPYLISRVVDMMKDASQTKQIIVTTHNPEIVKYAGLDNLLLVSRDEEGFSTISRPSNKEEVKTFLQNEIGVEELFVQNLLGI